MASLVLAIGAAIYYGVEKIHDHKEKKHGLKAQLHGPVVERSISPDHGDANSDEEHPPAYEKEWHQECPTADEHPALRSDERRKRRFVFRM
jgi:hypothetical protein